MKKYLDFWVMIRNIVREFTNQPNFKKAFIYGIILYALALFALIRGDIYYCDDWGSSIRETSWNHFSRYLGTFILNDFATFGKGSLDLSPLPQIMGVCFVIISAMILIYLIRKKFDLLGIVASLPLGLSPHFLQNLSYKFESLFMGVAVFLAIFPFLFKDNRKVFILVSIISLFLMFMTYQATNAIYIILSIYFAFSAFFLEKKSFKESIIFLSICAMSVVVAGIIYKLIILKPVSEYIVAYASDKMLPLDTHFFMGLLTNLTTYLTTIFNDFKHTAYIWLIALMSICFIINIAIRSNYPKILSIFASIVFLMVGLCLSFGIYVVLDSPLFEPRAFCGFNAFVAVICIASVSLQIDSKQMNLNKIRQITHYFSITIAIIAAYFLISFANIYGNALKKQDEYLDFRAKLLLEDLGDNIPKNANAMVDLRIYIDKHAVARRFADKYGDISRLVPKVANNDWWFYLRLHHLNAAYNFNDGELCKYIVENFGSDVVFKNRYHTIERAKTCYIVTLNK